MKKTTLAQPIAQASVLVVPTSGGADFGMSARFRATGAPIQADLAHAGIAGAVAGTRPWSPPIT